jgi:hypothetical protein
MPAAKPDPLDGAEMDPLIESDVIGPLTALGENAASDCALVFLTGSYARGTHSKTSPNVNIYFLARAGAGAELRLKVADALHDIRHALAGRGVDFCVDCHPYTVAYRPLEWPRSITLTTKVLELNERPGRWSLPPTIGLGWLPKFRVLTGDGELLKALDLKQSTDEEWFQALHEALSRYRNILDHLPWALPWHDHPELLAEESLRYAEEAIRDALPVAMTEEELREGLQFNLYFKWGGGSLQYLTERYGEDGAWMHGAVEQLKTRFQSPQTVWTQEAARDAWRTALRVWSIVWTVFSRRVEAEQPERARWMTRVNAFV